MYLMAFAIQCRKIQSVSNKTSSTNNNVYFSYLFNIIKSIDDELSYILIECVCKRGCKTSNKSICIETYKENRFVVVRCIELLIR